MSTYTQNYSLHQWEDSDDFLRTDFNEDFAKIDTALGRAERSATSNAYNIYNLILQNYYESKYTGYKSALLFDGFMDDSQISSMSDEMYLYDNALHLPGVAVTAPGSDYASATSVNMAYARATATYTATKSFDITGFSYKIGSSYPGAYAFTVTLYVNGTAVQTFSASNSVSYSATLYTATFTAQSVSVGDTFYVGFSNVSATVYLMASTDSSSYVGGYFTVDSLYADTGTMTAPTQTLESAPTQALAWVRHNGGTVTPSINGAEMTQVGQTETEEPQGATCLETQYFIETESDSDISLSFALDRGTEDILTLYDYGVIFL